MTARTDLKPCPAGSAESCRAGLVLLQRKMRAIETQTASGVLEEQCQCWGVTVLRNQVFQGSFGTSFCPRLSEFLL